ncbi:hypothetical protein HPB52_005785 [Rhipicephalus sanguineus]|uniref:Uncharacterized protein n=1 Tax=Rhipicephalus sanguineus TaxID=34632 RepID=A0A9D4PUJ6_RHISA|nr:hypothetical protein HPB52_005785 [Rhipicephalus sanguineus]
MLGEGRDRSASAVPSFCDSGSNAFHSDSESDSCTTTSQLSNRDDSGIRSAQFDSNSSDDVECEPRVDGGLHADSPSPNLSLDSSTSSDDEDDVECGRRVRDDSRTDELDGLNYVGVDSMAVSARVNELEKVLSRYVLVYIPQNKT